MEDTKITANASDRNSAKSSSNRNDINSKEFWSYHTNASANSGARPGNGKNSFNNKRFGKQNSRNNNMSHTNDGQKVETKPYGNNQLCSHYISIKVLKRS